MLIRQRNAIQQLQNFNVFRFAQSSDPEDFVKELRAAAGIPEKEYLAAPLDKAGLSALAGQLNQGAQTKV